MELFYKNILLVDDDHDDQEFFLEVLKAVAPEATCSVAENGLKAFEVLTSLPQMPDIIFLDLNMPIMGGHEFLRLIKQDAEYAAFANIPIVILTTSNSDAQRCYEMGACVYISKPSEVAAYREAITTVLTRDVVKDVEVLRVLMSRPQN